MKRGPIIAVFISIGLLVSLVVLPISHKPTEEVIIESLDQKIERAINLVTSSPSPMEGIMLLRQVLEEDPKNIKALSALGLFSIRSNQLENAITRFQQIVEIDSQNYLALEKLVELYSTAKDTLNWNQSLQNLYQVETDDEKRKRIENTLKVLEQEIVKS